MPPIELEAYFAKQLELEGWGRVAGSADEFFAWSSWLVPSVPPAVEWHGVLLVLADRPDERDPPSGLTANAQGNGKDRAADGF